MGKVKRDLCKKWSKPKLNPLVGKLFDARDRSLAVRSLGGWVCWATGGKMES